MKKKILICIILLLIGISFINIKSVYADTAKGMITSVLSGDSSDASSGKTGINKIIKPIAVIVKVSAIGIAVIMLTYLGIKYMSAAPTEKASIKNNMITFAIGAILVFGATEIVEKVMNFSQKTIT